MAHRKPCAPALALVVSQVLGCSGGAESAPMAPASTGADSPAQGAASCPLGVRGACIEFAASEGGAVLTFVAQPDDVEDLRARVRDVAALHGPRAHRGPGHDGEHLGAHVHGLRLTSLPPLTTSVEDVGAGARLKLVAVVFDQAPTLREQLLESVERVQRVPCKVE